MRRTTIRGEEYDVSVEWDLCATGVYVYHGRCQGWTEIEYFDGKWGVWFEDGSVALLTELKARLLMLLTPAEVEARKGELCGDAR